MQILSSIKKFFSSAASNVASVVKRVSPFVLAQMKPILVSAEENLWKTAYPLAVDIVRGLFTGNQSGLDKHATAVKQLEDALIASGKIVVTGVVRLHLGQIVLAAYANSPEVLAALSVVSAALA
jgi:hypothetical protein